MIIISVLIRGNSEGEEQLEKVTSPGVGRFPHSQRKYAEILVSLGRGNWPWGLWLVIRG